MTDFTYKAYAICDSIQTFQRQVNDYTVRHCAQHNKKVQYDFECTCPSFKYRPQTYCKHINQVKDELCGWSQFDDGGDVVIDVNGIKRCPKCGETVTYYTFAE